MCDFLPLFMFFLLFLEYGKFKMNIHADQMPHVDGVSSQPSTMIWDTQ